MNHYGAYKTVLQEALSKLDLWRESFGETPSSEAMAEDLDKAKSVADHFLERMKCNYPFHHPCYAGQMLKPPHPAAWLAYSLAMTINPNNHALDGGPPSSEMEKEVMDHLADMVGYDKYLGHLTSGGTIANLEALWIARELHPDKAIASTSEAHYTHSRMCRILNTKHLTIPVDDNYTPDFDFLEQHKDQIGTVVVTMGTTGLGTVEPMHLILEWAKKNNIRLHADAAYGGFFKLIAGEEEIDPKPWNALHHADSIVIDPHKHGLQPYGCGSILFKDPAVGRFYKHDSPYTYFTSEDLHLGEISLECSRAGASAAALWFTLELLPLNQEGLGNVLRSCRRAALDFSKILSKSKHFKLLANTELDIVTYFPVRDNLKASGISRLSKEIFRRGMEDAREPLYLSLYKVPAKRFSKKHPEVSMDADTVTILRSVLMKPEHEEYTGELNRRLEKLFEEVVGNPEH